MTNLNTRDPRALPSPAVGKDTSRESTQTDSTPLLDRLREVLLPQRPNLGADLGILVPVSQTEERAAPKRPREVENVDVRLPTNVQDRIAALERMRDIFRTIERLSYTPGKSHPFTSKDGVDAHTLQLKCERLIEDAKGYYGDKPPPGTRSVESWERYKEIFLKERGKFIKAVTDGMVVGDGDSLGQRYLQHQLTEQLQATGISFHAGRVMPGRPFRQHASSVSFERDGKSYSFGLDSALGIRVITTDAGPCALSVPATAPQVLPALGHLPETLLTVKTHLEGKLPADAKCDLRTGVVTYSLDGKSHLALRSVQMEIGTTSPRERAGVVNARGELTWIAGKLTECGDGLQQLCDSVIRKGTWPDLGRTAPRIRAILSEMQQTRQFDPAVTKGVPVELGDQLRRFGTLIDELAVARAEVARTSATSTAPTVRGKVIGSGDAAFDLHHEPGRNRALFVARDALGHPTVVHIVSLAPGGGTTTLNIGETCRSLGNLTKRADAMQRLREIGPLAAPGLVKLAADKTTPPGTLRTSLMLLNEIGVREISWDGATRPLAAVMGAALVNGTGGPRTAYARCLSSDRVSGPAAVRAVLQSRESTPFALTVAAEAAGMLGQKDEHAAGLTALLKHKEITVQRAAAAALGRLGERRGELILVGLMEDSEAPMSDRISAARHLLSVGGTHVEKVAAITAREPELSGEVCKRLIAEKSSLLGPFLQIHLRRPEGAIVGLRGQESVALEALSRAAIVGNTEALRDLLRIAADGSIPAGRTIKAGERDGRTEGGKFVTVEMAISIALARIERPMEVVEAAQFVLKERPGNTKLAEIVRSRRLGLEFIERFDPSVREQIMEARERAAPDPKKRLAVVIMPKTDYNGAFTQSSDTLKSLFAHGYDVRVYEARNVTEMIAGLHAGTAMGKPGEKRASFLLIGGHGSQTSTALGYPLPELYHGDICLPRDDDRGWSKHSGIKGAAGHHRSLGTGHAEYLKAHLNNKVLEKDGQIALDSCSTGVGHLPKWGLDPKSPNNIANLLRTAFPHARKEGIWSPAFDSSTLKLEFDEDNRIKRVNYGEIKSKDVYRAWHHQADPNGQDGV